MKELEKWYNQISLYERLNLKEAQDLYKEIVSIKDENLKKNKMNKLILGTLYVVYEYLERNRLELFISSSYDMDDIISSFNEVWIKKVYNGDLLKIDRYSLMFSSPYYNEVCNMLSEDINLFENSTGIIIQAFTEYVDYKNSSQEKSFEDIILENHSENRYIGLGCWSYELCYEVVKLTPFFERIYNNLNFDKQDDLNLKKTKINNYIKLLICLGVIEPINEESIINESFEDDIIKKVTFENFVQEVDLTLVRERMIKVIHDRYGLDGIEPMNLEKIGEKNNVTRERIRQIEAKSLRRLKLNQKFKKKYEGIII